MSKFLEQLYKIKFLVELQACTMSTLHRAEPKTMENMMIIHIIPSNYWGMSFVLVHGIYILSTMFVVPYFVLTDSIGSDIAH